MRLGGDQHALGVHAAQDVAEALPLLADQVLRRHFHVVEEHFGAVVVHHGADRPDGEALAQRLAHVDQEDRQALGALLGLLARRGARQQQHQVGMLGAAGPHLLAVHDVGAVVLLHRRRAQRQRVGAAGRLGDAERLQAQLAAGDLGQVALLLLLAAVPQQRAHDVHLGVAGGAIAAGALDFLEHRGCGRDAKPRAAVLLGNQDREPAGFGQRLHEFRRIAAFAIERAPVGAVELQAELADRIADFRVCRGVGIFHGART